MASTSGWRAKEISGSGGVSGMVKGGNGSAKYAGQTKQRRGRRL